MIEFCVDKSPLTFYCCPPSSSEEGKSACSFGKGCDFPKIIKLITETTPLFLGRCSFFKSFSEKDYSNFSLLFHRQTLLARAEMTMPRLVREELIAVISLNRSPWDWLFWTRSLPARSTKHKDAKNELEQHKNQVSTLPNQQPCQKINIQSQHLGVISMKNSTCKTSSPPY